MSDRVPDYPQLTFPPPKGCCSAHWLNGCRCGSPDWAMSWFLLNHPAAETDPLATVADALRLLIAELGDQRP